jgi:DNA-binding response OmpR family regulator
MAAESAHPLPRTLALVDDDLEYSQYLKEHLTGVGIRVEHFADSNDLLASQAPFEFGFYIVDLMLPGVDGTDLIGILRKRTQVGIVVVSGRVAPDVFAKVIDGGADMHLAKPIAFDKVVVAIRGVQRRVTTPISQAWLLDVPASRLLAPDGTAVALSETDLALMQCFLQAHGGSVTRETLCQLLGHPDTPESENLLSATVYRLRRRVERATPLAVPLHTQARVGYIFKGELRAL